jgi:hypothetical protein
MCLYTLKWGSVRSGRFGSIENGDTIAGQPSGSARGSTPRLLHLKSGRRVGLSLGGTPKSSQSGGLGFLAAHRPSSEPHEADHDR